ncbi:MAG TPA: DUF6502 family protein [Nitrospira sp.]|nr:DUF6502 family protein [Nitrospira sp.]
MTGTSRWEQLPNEIKSSHTHSLSSATSRLLYPLVRMFLRNGKGARSLYDLVKQVYVQLAKEEFGIGGKKATVSRIAILTGLTRKEVKALLAERRPGDGSMEEEYNRAARVIAGWLKDPRFGDGRGHPAPLPLGGKRGSFAALVKIYSGDIPVRAMLDELLHIGAVQVMKDDRICLRSRGYIPQKNTPEKLSILGTDTADLIATIDHNIYVNPKHPRFQRKVMYDNVPVEAAQEFQAIVAARGQELLEDLDRWLSHRDRDVNPSTRGTGRVRLGVGLYHFEERLEDESSETRKRSK